MKTLRKIILWSHLLAGVTAGLVIFSMSLTGVILMYEPQISELATVNLIDIGNRYGREIFIQEISIEDGIQIGLPHTAPSALLG